MKVFMIIFASLVSAHAFAGPSISAGPQEAPWVRSQYIFSQILKYAVKQNLALSAIQLDPADQTRATAQINCYNGTMAELVFRAKTSCQPNTIPGVCLPHHTLTLVQNESQSCN